MGVCARTHVGVRDSSVCLSVNHVLKTQAHIITINRYKHWIIHQGSNLEIMFYHVAIVLGYLK